MSVSRHEEEEGLKAAEGRLWADHKPDRLHPDHCPAEGLILFLKRCGEFAKYLLLLDHCPAKGLILFFLISCGDFAKFLLLLDHCPAEGLILFFDKVRWIC